MKRISAREANQHFSKLLAEVEGGEEVAITKRGVVVARIVPTAPSERDSADRDQAIRDMIRHLKENGLHLGGGPLPSRDEMHER